MNQGKKRFRRIIGYCYAVRDTQYLLPSSVISNLISTGQLSPGVSFPSEPHFHHADRLLSELAAGAITRHAGGPVSNTLHSVAHSSFNYPRPIELIWAGPYNVAHEYIDSDPLWSLREVGIQTRALPTATFGLAESLCVVNDKSGETVSILVGPRPQPAEKLRVDNDDLLLIALNDLQNISFDTEEALPCVAIVLADAAEMSEGTGKLINLLAAERRLIYCFGTSLEYYRLGLLGMHTWRHSSLENTELVVTSADQPVNVFMPSSNVAIPLPVEEWTMPEANALGAGDAYAGGYLFERLMGSDIAAAHGRGMVRARTVASYSGARSQESMSLDQLYGSYIERHSTTDDLEIVAAPRLSCGLTIVTCGNTGVDQQALRTAASFGLASFAIMPSGRRTEGTDLGHGADDFADALVLELGTSSYRYCTWANVYSGDGTLLLDYSGSEGSAETRRAARVLGRPMLELADMPLEDISDGVRKWVQTHAIRVLHVAGNRAGTLPVSMESASRSALSLAMRAAAGTVRPRPLRRDVTELSRSTQAADLPQNYVPQELRPRIGIPKLYDVSSAFWLFLGSHSGHLSDNEAMPEQLTWEIPGCEIVRARSLDLVNMLDNGFLDAALVGYDMVLEAGTNNISVISGSGFFNCLVVEIARSPEIRRRGLPAVTQYPRIANRYKRSSTTTYPILGAAEAWLSTGQFGYAVDTWRTGKTARANGSNIVGVYESTSLVLVAQTGDTRSAAVTLGLEFLKWLGLE